MCIERKKEDTIGLTPTHDSVAWRGSYFTTHTSGDAKMGSFVEMWALSMTLARWRKPSSWRSWAQILPDFNFVIFWCFYHFSWRNIKTRVKLFHRKMKMSNLFWLSYKPFIKKKCMPWSLVKRESKHLIFCLTLINSMKSRKYYTNQIEFPIFGRKCPQNHVFFKNY